MTAASTSTSSSMDVMDRLYGSGGLNQAGVKIITLAPDVEGVMDCIPALSDRGVTVSLGHTYVASGGQANSSNASLEVAEEAVKKGARMITHLFK